MKNMAATRGVLIVTIFYLNINTVENSIMSVNQLISKKSFRKSILMKK